MMKMKNLFWGIPVCLVCSLMLAQTHQHDHEGHEHGEKKPVEPPKIFLDKSLRIVQYQLSRLDNERLLLVERKTDDPKYAPVYSAILTRAGMSPQYREEALQGLVTLNKSDASTELLKILESIDAADSQELRTGQQLSGLLLAQTKEELSQHTETLLAATKADSNLYRAVGYAGLITADRAEIALKQSQADESATLDFLQAVPLLPKPQLRSSLREPIVKLLMEGNPVPVRKEAIAALATVPKDQAETFQLLAPFLGNAELRFAAVRTMLKIPPKERDPETSARLVAGLVDFAEQTPPAERTTDEFIDAMQLCDQILATVPVEQAREYRARLREITVRVVRIRTVEEEMRYDTPYFAVEAGRPVQVVLQNEDLMPHNFVITVNGALQEVAELGALVGPSPADGGKPYVPKSDQVLFATDMVQAHQQTRLTFDAPSELGEYPYVCTFPRHWMRMYGVMVVVPDLDAWLKNPTVPKDPIGSNRSFVQAWTIEDFQDELDEGLRGRTPEIGAKLFKEATCALCHKVKGEGGAVGPELTDAFKRWKGDRLAVLREILDPSHRIDPKYAMQVIVTDQGKVVTGIVQAEDAQTISILDNPEAKEPTVVKRSEIEEIVKTSKSMMPKALLDRFSKDEILEILAFLEGLSTAAN